MKTLPMFAILVGAGLLPCLGFDMNAYQQGADAKIVYRVVDDKGTPVTNALVRVWFRSDYPKLVVKDWEQLSDSKGEFVAQHWTNERVSIGVDKEGYYRTFDRVTFRSNSGAYKVANGRWEPYGETRTVVLKKIRKMGALSVPNMSEYSNRERKIPAFNQWLPYDLERFDWNAPHGKGSHADVLLRFRNRVTPRYNDFTYCMDICFTNNPLAGVYEVKQDSSSDFKTVYEANSNAMYKSEISFVSEKTSDGKRVSDYLKEDSYLVFRTRTVVDEKGQLQSAHYGAIFGPWRTGKDRMQITDGCFNPVNNDCNIEDSYYLREKVKHYQDSKKENLK